MKRKGILLLVAVLIALGAGYAVWAHRASGPPPPSATVLATRDTVVRTISADGTLRPKTKVTVKSYAGGNVDLLAVEVGDVVHKGDLIARIDPTESRATYEQAAADMAAAQAKLTQAQDKAAAQPALTQMAIAQARANYDAVQHDLAYLDEAKQPQARASAQSALNKAKASLALAEAELTRAQELQAKGYIAQSDLDTVVNKRDLAAAEAASAREQWDTLARQLATERQAAQAKVAQAKAALEQARTNSVEDRVTRSDVANAHASVARAQAQVTQATTTLGYTTITAPRDGVILEKYVEAGTIVASGRSSVTSGTDIVLLGDTTEMYIDVKLDEADIGMVKTGQRASVSVDAFPDDRFHGEVTRIDPQAATDQNVTTVLVTVRVSDPSPKLRPGMTATCEFAVGQAKDVLCLPNLAVQQQGRDHIVLLREGEQTVPVPVEIGLVGDSLTEVRLGLSEGQQVELPFQGGAQTEGGGPPDPGRQMGGRMGGTGGFVRQGN